MRLIYYKRFPHGPWKTGLASIWMGLVDASSRTSSTGCPDTAINPWQMEGRCLRPKHLSVLREMMLRHNELAIYLKFILRCHFLTKSLLSENRQYSFLLHLFFGEKKEKEFQVSFSWTATWSFCLWTYIIELTYITVRYTLCTHELNH